MSHHYQEPLWITLASRLVNQAQRDLAKKARLVAKIKALYTIESRATLKLSKGV